MLSPPSPTPFSTTKSARARPTSHHHVPSPPLPTPRAPHSRRRSDIQYYYPPVDAALFQYPVLYHDGHALSEYPVLSFAVGLHRDIFVSIICALAAFIVTLCSSSFPTSVLLWPSLRLCVCLFHHLWAGLRCDVVFVFFILSRGAPVLRSAG